MTALGRRLCFIGLVLGCVMLPSSADKFRFLLKAIRPCKLPPLAIDITVLKITYSNRGNFFHIDSLFVVNKDINLTKATVDVFRDGGINRVKFFGFSYPEYCKTIMTGNFYTNPLFAPGALPRACAYEKQNFTAHIDYDLHGDVPGAMLIRGPFIAEFKTYDGDELVQCMDIHLNAIKDTLN